MKRKREKDRNSSALAAKLLLLLYENDEKNIITPPEARESLREGGGNMREGKCERKNEKNACSAVNYSILLHRLVLNHYFFFFLSLLLSLSCFSREFQRIILAKVDRVAWKLQLIVALIESAILGIKGKDFEE
mgnify:CR=1 FL=1